MNSITESTITTAHNIITKSEQPISSAIVFVVIMTVIVIWIISLNTVWRNLKQSLSNAENRIRVLEALMQDKLKNQRDTK